MRVQLLLILFFATTILARSARDKRDTNVTTIEPPQPTTEANNESTTTNVTGDKCNGNNYENNTSSHPLKMMSVFIRSILIFINKILLMFLHTLNSMSNSVLHIMIQPFVEPLRIMITIMKWMLHFI